jgi:hypothetical protein
MTPQGPLQARETAHPPRMTERQLQEAIIACAKLLHWHCYHTWLSTRSAPGYPDLTMVRASRLLFVEVKSATGKLSPHQELWLGVLGGVPCVEVFVWRPEQWFDGTIERWLR